MLLRRFALPLGLVDYPGGRKTHDVPVPVIGGLAMYLGGLLPLELTNLHGAAFVLILILGLLAVIGALDDRVQLSSRVRFAAELAAAAVLIANGDSVHYLGDLLGFGPIGASVMGPLFTFVCYVGVVNAVNMSDGIDGLAGSLAIVACAWFAVIALVGGHAEIAGIVVPVFGVLISFLAFNLRTPWRAHAAVFMGDAGTMVLGFLLAWFAVKLAGQGPALLTPIGAVWILAVPLLDEGSVMLYRLRCRVSPFRSDRLHAHYVLIDRGISVSGVVAVMVTAGVICGALGVGFPLLGIPEWVMFAGFLMLWGLVYKWISRAHKAIAKDSPALVHT